MLVCMRTTLNLDDDLMRALKHEAAESGRTMTEIIEEALRDRLARERAQAESFELRWVAVKGKALPGVDITDRDSLYERMEGRS